MSTLCPSLRTDGTCWRFPQLGVIRSAHVCRVCDLLGGYDKLKGRQAPPAPKPCVHSHDLGPAAGYPCCRHIDCLNPDCPAHTHHFWLSRWCGPDRCKFFREKVE